MVLEKFGVELSMVGEGVVHVTVQIYGDQTAAVIGAERNLAAGIRADRAVSQIRITVGHRFAENGIPEEDSRFRRFPGIVDYFLPQCGSVYLLGDLRRFRIDGVFLDIRSSSQRGTHEFVIHLHGNIGTGHLAEFHLGIDERFGIGMLDGNGQHQSSAASVLGHFTGGVGVSLHERYHTGRGERTVQHRAAGRSDMGEVVSHAAPALHKLHLLLVYLHNAAVRVGRMTMTYHETVRQGCYLMGVPDTRHGSSLRDYIFEISQEFEYLIGGHRIGILGFHSGELVSQAAVHLVRRLLVKITERVLHRVFVYPYGCSQFISPKVFPALCQGFVVGVCHKVSDIFILLIFSVLSC